MSVEGATLVFELGRVAGPGDPEPTVRVELPVSALLRRRIAHAQRACARLGLAELSLDPGAGVQQHALEPGASVARDLQLTVRTDGQLACQARDAAGCLLHCRRFVAIEALPDFSLADPAGASGGGPGSPERGPRRSPDAGAC